MCFSPYLGVVWGGGALRGAGVHNLLMQFSSFGSSKMEIPVFSEFRRYCLLIYN